MEVEAIDDGHVHKGQGITVEQPLISLVTPYHAKLIAEPFTIRPNGSRFLIVDPISRPLKDDDTAMIPENLFADQTKLAPGHGVRTARVRILASKTGLSKILLGP